jgi:hypothetical protein
LRVDRRAQITTRTVTIIVTNIELVNQLAFEIRTFGVTVSSAASKYVSSIGISLSSDNDTAPALWRKEVNESRHWRVKVHESNAHEDMQAVL